MVREKSSLMQKMVATVNRIKLICFIPCFPENKTNLKIRASLNLKNDFNISLKIRPSR